MLLSKNFSLAELTKSATATRKGIDNTPDAKITERLRRLATEVLQPLRDAFGEPIVVSSGYRCPALNKAVGGSATSQHMQGTAADIHVLSDRPADNRRLFDCAKRLMDEGKIKVGQLIDEYGYDWVHISLPGNHVNQVLHLK